MHKPLIRFRVDFDAARSIGPGKIELLEHIRETGSLSKAGREIGMSYRRAWILLDSMNTAFREPVVATSVGGAAGGGALLTPFGERLVDVYRGLEQEFNSIADKKFVSFGKLIGPAKKQATTIRTPLVRSAAPRRVKAKSRGRA
ncbi:MAG: LysR family transcriptional regulator [Candidatus Obscuribacterales bacterium]|nr:LysR family transcriptional regulator [Steroidobacteraceae bacterium]